MNGVRLLFAREAEGVYRLGHGTIPKMIKQRKLRGIRRGKRTLVSVSECERVLGVPA